MAAKAAIHDKSLKLTDVFLALDYEVSRERTD